MYLSRYLVHTQVASTKQSALVPRMVHMCVCMHVCVCMHECVCMHVCACMCECDQVL